MQKTYNHHDSHHTPTNRFHSPHTPIPKGPTPHTHRQTWLFKSITLQWNSYSYMTINSIACGQQGGRGSKSIIVACGALKTISESKSLCRYFPWIKPGCQDLSPKKVWEGVCRGSIIHLSELYDAPFISDFHIPWRTHVSLFWLTSGVKWLSKMWFCDAPLLDLDEHWL